MFRVSAVNELTDDVVEAVQRLLPQLSSSARALGRSELEEIVRSSATTLLVARDEEVEAAAADAENPHGPVVGMLTLVTFRIPTGVRAWIEDVVVDKSERGRGIGEALTQAALEMAAARGAKTVDLTSRPSREVANRLYQRVGFELRDSNVYRHQLAP